MILPYLRFIPCLLLLKSLATPRRKILLLVAMAATSLATVPVQSPSVDSRRTICLTWWVLLAILLQTWIPVISCLLLLRHPIMATILSPILMLARSPSRRWPRLVLRDPRRQLLSVCPRSPRHRPLHRMTLFTLRVPGRLLDRPVDELQYRHQVPLSPRHSWIS